MGQNTRSANADFRLRRPPQTVHRRAREPAGLTAPVPLAQDAPMARYNIVSFDNATAGQLGARLDRGEFDSAEAALERARQLVDRALEQLRATSSPQELM